jgi:hypothetical protein
MTSVALFANSLPVPVWSHQLCSEALSSAMPILTLPGRYPCAPDARPVKIVAAPPQSRTSALGPIADYLRSELRQPFKPHRSAVGQRFSPIHF